MRKFILREKYPLKKTEYFRKVLGYTCARVYFILYGKGSNCKSKVARL